MAQQRIELIKPYGMHAKGAILVLDVPVASLLIQTGRAAAVETKKKKLPSKEIAVTENRERVID